MHDAEELLWMDNGGKDEGTPHVEEEDGCRGAGAIFRDLNKDPHQHQHLHEGVDRRQDLRHRQLRKRSMESLI